MNALSAVIHPLRRWMVVLLGLLTITAVHGETLRTVAVFPFHNAGGQAEYDWLAMGLQEALSSDLRHVSGLNVKGMDEFIDPLNQRCQKLAMSCLAATGTRDAAALAAGQRYGAYLHGEYRVEGNGLRVDLQWNGKPIATVTAPLNKLHMKIRGPLLPFVEKLGHGAPPFDRQGWLGRQTRRADTWPMVAEIAVITAGGLTRMGDVAVIHDQWRNLTFQVEGMKPNDAAAMIAKGKYTLFDAALFARRGAKDKTAQSMVPLILDDTVQSFKQTLQSEPRAIEAVQGLAAAYDMQAADRSRTPADRAALAALALAAYEEAWRLNPGELRRLEDFSGALTAGKDRLGSTNGIDPTGFLPQGAADRPNTEQLVEAVDNFFQGIADKLADAEGAGNREILARRARADFDERYLGPDHYLTLKAKAVLAHVLQHRNETAAAAEIIAQLNSLKTGNPEQRRQILWFTRGVEALAKAQAGRFGEAMDLWDALLKESDIVKSFYLAPRILDDAGTFYMIHLDQPAKALTYYDRSLSLTRNVYKDYPRIVEEAEITHLANRALALGRLGRFEEAADAYRKVLEYHRSHNRPLDTALTLMNYAAMLDVQAEQEQDDDKQRQLREESIALSRESLREMDRFDLNHPKRISIVLNLAHSLHMTGKPEEAIELVSGVLPAVYAVDAIERRWRAEFILADALAEKGELEAAVFHGKLAVNMLQSMRESLAGKQTQTSDRYNQARDAIYRSLASWLLQLNRLAEAQTVIAMLKEYELHQFLRGETERDPRKTTIAFFSSEQEWHRLLDSVAENRPGTGKTEWDKALGEIRKAALKQSESRQSRIQASLESLPRIRQLVAQRGRDTAVLQTLLSQDKLYLLLTTADGTATRTVPVTSRELSASVVALRRAMETRTDPVPAAQQLYGRLIAPLESELSQAGVKHLLVSLDSVLRYLPVGVLHDGKGWLLERYSLATLTEATADEVGASAPNTWKIAGFGLTHKVEGFPPLPGVRKEIDGIVRDGKRGILPGEKHFDHDFTSATVKSALSRQLPVVHLASHFALKPGDEGDSFLLMGDGSHFSLRDMRAQLDFRHVELLALSACDTAGSGGGAEIESFGALAREQGARNVLATLWKVADASTGTLMQAFYRNRVAAGLSAPEALRQAQLSMLRGETWRHPFYWAPFVLMGDGG